MRIVRWMAALPLLAALGLMTGCTATAPQYQATNNNVGVLSGGSGKVGVGEFKLGPKGESLNHLTIRGSSYVSPVDKSWAAYLREALKAELAASSRLDDKSATVVTGTLLTNELDGSGTSVGTARISADFVVVRNGTQTYRRTLTADGKWESSFIGGIAIPAAQQHYVATVSALLSQLFADPDFVGAIK